MAIIIEGMDNSGKSILAQVMAEYMGLIVQESEGPPIDEDEINDRVDRYERMTDRLFVRHPVISNAIYGQVREEGDIISEGRRMLFYENKHTIIYCDAGTRGLGAHVQKAHDTEKHLEDITNNYNKLLYFPAGDLVEMQKYLPGCFFHSSMITFFTWASFPRLSPKAAYFCSAQTTLPTYNC